VAEVGPGRDPGGDDRRRTGAVDLRLTGRDRRDLCTISAAFPPSELNVAMSLPAASAPILPAAAVSAAVAAATAAAIIARTGPSIALPGWL
jgi:hypothetical protein